MRKFDTKVQHLKYKVLREVAKEAWNGTLLQNALRIPYTIVPGKTPTMRCCVYKERAILAERVRLACGSATGGDKEKPNVIEVIDIACDECPMGGYEVTNACRGCLAHRCEDVCKRGAISFDHLHVAHIDKSKCVGCGACAKVCPYSAILSRKRPCENACKVGAISMNEDHAAAIDNEKCIACGACVYQCPFGAIMDRSDLLTVIDLLKSGEQRVYALVAPSISSQFTYAKRGQVITGLRKLGFHAVAEAALGADIVAKEESRELAKTGFLTSSCCPAFVSYVRKAFPQLEPYISQSPSPMAAIARYIKETEGDVKIVFIGPCTAKKLEVRQDAVRPYVDAVMTFEELQALFDSREIELTALEGSDPDRVSSYFGRIFARCGGLSEAVAQGLREQGLTDFELKSCTCDGIEECRAALLRRSKDLLDANFIEGMACVGGCIGGAGCLTHGARNRAQVDQYGREAHAQTIEDALSTLKTDEK